MSAGSLAFGGGWLASAFLVAWWSGRVDRVLRSIVVASLVVRTVGAVGIGMYLEQTRGRDYLADDEPQYQYVGEAILAEWQGGVQYEESAPLAITGSYSFWNALVMWLWGGASLLPMRLANGLAATLTVVLAYLLARSLFADMIAARAAAILVATSPSLFVWSVSNLKETFLAFGVLGSVAGAVAVMQRRGLWRVVVWLGFLVFLGSVRRYYAVALAWLSLAAYLFLDRSPVPRRLVVGVVLCGAAALALFAVTGSVLGIGVTAETVGRYVAEDGFSTQVEYLTFPPDLGVLFGNVPWVLFGRFDARAEVGLLMSLLLLPEWLANFVVIPLACLGVRAAMRRGRREVLLPVSFAVVMMLMLSWIYGDAWTIYRFRATYSSLVLTLAGGGAASILRERRDRLTATRGTSDPIPG